MIGIQRIILSHEDLAALHRHEPIRVEHVEYAPLVIEFLGKGPTDRFAIGVSQFVPYGDSGRLLCDREKGFEISANDEWLLLTFEPNHRRTQGSLYTRTASEVVAIEFPIKEGPQVICGASASRLRVGVGNPARRLPRSAEKSL